MLKLTLILGAILVAAWATTDGFQEKMDRISQEYHGTVAAFQRAAAQWPR